VTKAATIHDGDPYTQGLTDTFEREFTELGGEIVLKAAVNSPLSRYNSASDVHSPVFSTLVSASATTRSLSAARPAFPYVPLSRRPAP